MAAIVVAANVPWPSRTAAAPSSTLHTGTTNRILPQPVSGLKPHTIARSTVRGGLRVRTHHVSAEYKSGPCEFHIHGRDADFSYRATTSAGGRSLTLAIHHGTVVTGSGHGLSALATDIIEVTSDGATLVKVESKHNSKRSSSQSSGTMRFEYGAAVRGIRAATVNFEGSSIRSTIDTGPPSQIHNARTLQTLHARFASDASPVAIGVDRPVYDGIKSLIARFASERKTCSSKPPLLKPRSVTSRATFIRSFGKRAGDAEHAQRVVADADRAPATYGGSAGLENQNEYGAPSTPNCNSCMNAAANQAAGCWETLGVDLLFGCAPCVAAAIQCQAAATDSALGCWIPGAGCMQTVCGPGNGCDSGDTCCGSKCCTGNAICVGQPSTCCPPGYTTACSGSSGPFCCSADQMCCGNDLCCDEGSNCCGSFCCPKESACCGQSCCSPGSMCADKSTSLCCPADYTVCGSNCCPPHATCRNGVCCEGAFCGDQCCVNGQLCNQSTGTCYYPSFGTPKPQPSGSRYSMCLHGLSTCQSHYRDGSTKDVCCPPGLACCAGTCCAAGQQCGGNGAEYACGNWIR